jgi:competence/damage-inducible protein CinA-like protein
MPSAEIIAIGTELLLGEIQDTNSRFLARQLRDVGVDLFRITSIGDNAARIASAINEAFTRVDIVITTGGLGPTVDDPSREAVALAFHTTTEFHPELWKTIEARFLRRGVVPTENNKKQAYLPAGAEVIPNPVGTAPAFWILKEGKSLFCLPGVPKEMEYLTLNSVLPLLKQTYQLSGVIKVRVIHLSGVGESAVDQPIADLERLSNPTVGLLAHPGVVDIRITAKAADLQSADAMIAPIEKQILDLFPDDICGFDEETPALTLLRLCKERNIRIHVQEFGLAAWPQELSQNEWINIQPLNERIDLDSHTAESSETNTLSFRCNYFDQEAESHFDFALAFNCSYLNDALIYNGPQAQGHAWAVNRALDVMRRMLLKNSK